MGYWTVSFRYISDSGDLDLRLITDKPCGHMTWDAYLLNMHQRDLINLFDAECIREIDTEGHF